MTEVSDKRVGPWLVVFRSPATCGVPVSIYWSPSYGGPKERVT